jgi:ferrous iron transport protein B
MHWQSMIVALLVSGCSAYAVWTLMPSAARRLFAAWMLKLPLPALLAAPFERAARTTSGCGCDGCDRSELKPKAAVASNTGQPLTFHPRLPR